MSTKRKKDDYDLINSNAISNHCRKIKYQFNTEELAVLVYRNKKMDMDEKIAKYQDLIDNYPDMEVRERLNCDHYDSVKDLIKEEIERIQNLYSNLIKEDENCYYTWSEYNRTTKDFSKSYDMIYNSEKTYKEVYKTINDDINEYDDTLYFTIIKKYFDNDEKNIYAHYYVKDKKPKLIKIHEEANCFPNLDGIFVNIPTPFKKGDILISEASAINYYKDNEGIFVLDYLCSWHEEKLKKNHASEIWDSSDMMGYGYYLIDDTIDLIRDHKWNYDSFEYYKGGLEGKNRILKLVSSFIKGKINLELLIRAYKSFKADYESQIPNCYLEEDLKLAGFSELDILTITGHQEKIYNMPEEERMDYIKYRTNGLKGIEEENIKQIESDFDNNVFVLTKDNKLYKNGELIDKKIKKIYMIDGMHLYKITDNKKIRPITDESKWDNTDKYLNNNDCSYKKIVMSRMNIVALTKEGKVKEIHQYPTTCTIPENYFGVKDITIIEENGLDIPYVCKNNKYVELYTN